LIGWLNWSNRRQHDNIRNGDGGSRRRVGLHAPQEEARQVEPPCFPGCALALIEVYPHRPGAVADAFVQVEIGQGVAGLGGTDLVRETEGTGFIVGLVAVEQQAGAQPMGRPPEILGGVLDLGVDEIGSRLAPGWGRGRERPEGLAFAADGGFQFGHLIDEAPCRHVYNIRQ
jgi:hypothetical protein